MIISQPVPGTTPAAFFQPAHRGREQQHCLRCLSKLHQFTCVLCADRLTLTRLVTFPLLQLQASASQCRCNVCCCQAC